MSRLKEGWYVGRYKGNLSEICYGYLVTGYLYMGGPEKRPYSHEFWGLVWAGDYTFGIGRVMEEKRGDEAC